METASLHAAAAALTVAYLSEPAHADINVDPVGSPLWPTIQQEVFGAARTTLDSRIRIAGPAPTEDTMQVPIAFDALTLGKMERTVVTVDHNPIRKVLESAPMHIRPALSLRFKLQEASAVRTAARTPDGVWHADTLQVDTTGGSCTLPGVTRQNATWNTTLNQVESCVFPGSNGAGGRIRLRVMHPMDIGLVVGIPSFHTGQSNLLDARHQPVLELALHEPVAEDPIFSFGPGDPIGRGISVAGVGNDGSRIRAQVTR